MKTIILTTLSLFALVAALALQPNQTAAVSTAACGGCTNSVSFACGGCTNQIDLACGSCTNSISLACGGCTNSMDLAMLTN